MSGGRREYTHTTRECWNETDDRPPSLRHAVNGWAAAPLFGLAVCVPPAVVTYRIAVAVCRRWPEAGPTVLMAATAVRMGWAVVAVFTLAPRAPAWGTTPTAVAEWTTGFYLLTLAAESALLVRRLNRPAAVPPPAGGDGRDEPAGR